MDDSQINQPSEQPTEAVEGEVVGENQAPTSVVEAETEAPQEETSEPTPEPVIEVPTTEPVTPEETSVDSTNSPQEETPVIPQSPEPVSENPPEGSGTPPPEAADAITVGEPTPEEILNVPPPPVLDATGVEMSTIRSDETGDKVYLLREKKRYWIKNPETLGKLGFYLGKEKRLPFSELLAFPEGEPMDLTIPGFVMPWDRPIEEQKSDKSSNIWA